MSDLGGEMGHQMARYGAMGRGSIILYYLSSKGRVI
jgi:hypothetical protein